MSRIWQVLLSFAATFASKELAAAQPYVDSVVNSLPADLVASKPLVAFTTVVHTAMTNASNDPAVVPSLTGILGAAAGAALGGFAPKPAA